MPQSLDSVTMLALGIVAAFAAYWLARGYFAARRAAPTITAIDPAPAPSVSPPALSVSAPEQAAPSAETPPALQHFDQRLRQMETLLNRVIAEQSRPVPMAPLPAAPLPADAALAEDVYRLADTGQALPVIAGALAISRGEVALLLAVRSAKVRQAATPHAPVE